MAEKKFEKGLEELKEIVTALEEKELGLDESLALFEKGVTLSKSLARKLSEAEKRLEKIKEELAASIQDGEEKK